MYICGIKNLVLIGVFLIANHVFAQFFTPNNGQWQNPSIAKTLTPFGAFFINNNGFKVKQLNPNECLDIHKVFHKKLNELLVHGNILNFNWINATTQKWEFVDSASYYENYYINADKRQWRSYVYPVKKVTGKGIYTNTDIDYYYGEKGLEFDLTLHVGANPKQLKLQIEGLSQFDIEKNGDLVISHYLGNFILNKPVAFQIIQGKKVIVEAEYLKLEFNIIGFKVGTYNLNYDLIIDPVLVFSTYSGSVGDNFGFTATYDSKGHLYAGGIIDTTQGSYPITAGAYQVVYGGGGLSRVPVNLPCDISISKYLPNGTNLLYATYLGGFDTDYPHSLVCDDLDNLIVMGTTWSSNFPVKSNAYDNSFNGKFDIFISKLNPTGSTLFGSTYLGSNEEDGQNPKGLLINYADEFRGDVITDFEGNIHIATTTSGSAFPITPNAYQKIIGGANDAVYVKLNSTLTSMLYGTFIGNTKDDAAYSVRIYKNLVYLGGGTTSTDIKWPNTALNPSYIGGGKDGFLCAFTLDSSKFTYGTQYGTTGDEVCHFVDLDRDGLVYCTGQTTGQINRTSGKYGKDNSLQYISALNANLGSLKFETCFGFKTSGKELSPSAFLVDKCYNIYFSGWGSLGGSSTGLETTADAFQKTTDDEDFYLLVLNKYATNLVYATYFGGDESGDHVDGGTSRFDKNGIVYQSVCASCPDNPPGLQDFPTTTGAYSVGNPSYRCSNASFKFDFNITYAVDASFTYFPKIICTNDSITFTNTSKPGAKYFWDFGDGTLSSLFNPKHKYVNKGKYTVTLTLIDTASCNKSDIVSLPIVIGYTPTSTISINQKNCSSEFEFKLNTGNFDPEFRWEIGAETYTDKEFLLNLKVGTYPITVFLKNKDLKCYDTIKTVLNNAIDSVSVLKLSNVFTPNKDGKNDCWGVKGLNTNCEEIDLTIYNRWSEVLFKTKSVTDCWYGFVNDTAIPVPDGTYFYILNVKNKNTKKRETISGSIKLIW